jgi:hypothetical protein
MATSATTSYNLTAQRLIDMCLTDVGATGPGVTDANLRPHALELLNVLIKQLDVDGVLLWKVPRRTETLTAGTASYVLSNDVYDLDEPARYVQSGATYGSQVTAMARDEYMSTPDRTIQGPPTRYYVEKALDASGIEQITLYLYPVPPNTGDTLEYAAVIRAKDVTTLAQTLDVPQKWLAALRWGLCQSLGPSYNVPIDRMSWFGARFEESKRTALLDDNERGNVQLVPYQNSSYNYGSTY